MIAAVSVASEIPKPDIVPLVDSNKGGSFFRFVQDPIIRTTKDAMLEIDWLLI